MHMHTTSSAAATHKADAGGGASLTGSRHDRGDASPFHQHHAHSRRAAAMQFKMMNFGRATSRSNSGGSNGGGMCASSRALSAVLMAAALVVALAMLTVPRLTVSPTARSANATRVTDMFAVVKNGGRESRGGGRSGVQPAVTPVDVSVLVQGDREETTSQAAVASRNGRSEEMGRNERSDDGRVSMQGQVSMAGGEVSAQGAMATSDTNVVREQETITSKPLTAVSNALAVTSTQVTASSKDDPADFSTFSTNTALNYFHLHKTGGVSFKERLFNFFFQKERLKSNGKRARVLDTCHLSGPRRPEMGLEAEWSCDWDELQEMAEGERNKIDVIVGHQYWEQGAEHLLPHRDVRYFTVMRHPLHRKISFFYHFFVRNTGRSEATVEAKEVIAFVLGRAMPRSPLVRDAGPGYYASRLWSDGWSGFGDLHRFVRAEKEGETLVTRSIERLRRHFVFIGLQTQERASLCMLRRTVSAFARAQGIANMEGVEDMEKQKKRMNAGGYALTGMKVWERMSNAEKEEFRSVEHVDLGIYRESKKIFDEMVRRFGCEHLVEERDDDDMAL